MKCCPECFGDRGLRHNIFPLFLPAKGKCSFCAAESQPLLNPTQLQEYFELLVSAYRSDATGKLLVHWFREDWGLFANSPMNDSKAKELLSEVLDDGDIVRKSFLPSEMVDKDRLSEWEKLREELMYRNRFFPDVELDEERLKNLLAHLSVTVGEVPDVWYRARISTEDVPFPIEKMGAPDRRIATHGRANPAGIPYLYLGSNPKTAVSEIRPHTGERACVADFRTPSDLKLVDLRAPRRTVSPFLLADALDIQRMRNDLPFLERLGLELTTPVLPQAAAVDYTPSQFLCEFVKRCSYDGVIYRSSVSDGMNLALFYPAKAKPGAVVEYSVTNVTVAVSEIRTVL
ncbi:MAG: RES family NAD+ phosphorylase [Nitrospira sp.]